MPEAFHFQLLRRAVAHRDEAAFAALLERHSRLVLGVCRRLLPRDQDAQDAFQATFLVLARQAAAGRHDGAVVSRLYRLAHRASTAARQDAARHLACSGKPVGAPGPASRARPAWHALQAMLDGELNRLPPTYLAPF